MLNSIIVDDEIRAIERLERLIIRDDRIKNKFIKRGFIMQNITETKKVKLYDFETITNRMKKDYGYMKKGTEELYAMLLFPKEEVLLKAYLKNENLNNYKAKEAINSCLFKTKGYIDKINYDCSKFMEPESIELSNNLAKTFIPFENEDIYDMLKDEYDFDSSDVLKNYFEDHIKSLVRIYESVIFWDKSLGSKGYFNFIKDTLPNQIDTKYDRVNFLLKS